MIDYLFIIPASLLAIILHELGHSVVSYILGDPTPKEEGRLTLNPLKHLDWMGILCMIFFHVGWAKPVKINPYYYKNKKLGITLVSIAGPLTNIILAILSGFLTVLFLGRLNNSTIFSILGKFFQYFTILNIGLGLFNLIPIPPLDGSKILGAFIPERFYDKYMSYQRYGMYFMIVIILILNVLENFGMPSILNDGIDYIYKLIINLWYNVLLS